MLQVESLEQNPTISTGDKTAKKETGCRVWGVGYGVWGNSPGLFPH